MSSVFFNLFTNAACSLLAGLLVASFFIWTFDIRQASWRLFFLSLPFFKILLDCLQGVPSDSILFSGLDPFNLPPKSRALTIEARLGLLGPVFEALFWVRNKTGEHFSASLGDYLHYAILRFMGPRVPQMLLTLTVTVSGYLLGRRLWGVFKFRRAVKQVRKVATTLRFQKIGRRTVHIFTTDQWDGTPFTGGLVNPYICLPAASIKDLSHEEIEAVISHEIGHIQQWDLPVALLIYILGDIFWFIPGYRLLRKKIDRLREIVADERAVKSGVSSVHLASALLKLQEETVSAKGHFVYSAFFKQKSFLKVRIESLLQPIPKNSGRWGWQNRRLRWVLAVWMIFSILACTLGGNRDTSVPKVTGPLHFQTTYMASNGC